MAPILAMFVPGTHILEVRSSSDPTLPNGKPMFRKTQGFNDINPAFPQFGAHNALDVGNFFCGDEVYAPIAGRARTWTDSAGAKCITITSTDGKWSVVIAHLLSWSIPTGVTTSVSQRQLVGIVGNTGLGAVCHVHLELREHTTSGIVKHDPWPQMEQFLSEGDNMKIYGDNRRKIHNKKTSLTVGSNFRPRPDTNNTEIAVLDNGQRFEPVVVVTGEKVGTAPDASDWYFGMLWVSGEGLTGGYLHSSVLKRTPDNSGVVFEPIEIIGGITQENLDKAVADAIEAQSGIIAGLKTDLAETKARISKMIAKAKEIVNL